jgi:uncharacterized protein (TIGR02145 family)
MWFKDGVHQNSISQIVSGSQTYIEAGIGTWFAAVDEGSCSSTKSNEITVSKDPLAGTVITAPIFTINGSAAGGIVNVCAGGTLLLDVTNTVGGVTYSWYVNNDKKGEGAHYELNMSGLSGDFILQCRATNASECSSAGVSQISVSLGSAPAKPVISSNTGSVLCGSSATLSTSSTAAKYRWYKDGAFLAETAHPTNTYTVSALGTYSLQIVDALGCVSELSNGLNINQNSAYGSVEITPQISSIDVNQSRSFTANINPEDAASTYSWTITGATPTTATGKTVLVTFGTVGTAHISVTATNACTPGGVSALVNGTTGVSVNAACPAPAVTAYDPASKTALIMGSGSTSLTVTPNGNPTDFTYLWYKDGAATTTTTQTISATQGGTYYCAVTAKCGGAPVNSDNFTVTAVVIPEDSKIGSGTLTGKTCFDIAESNFDAVCGIESGRTATKANFANASTHTQVYTFTKSTGTVKNVRYAIQDPNMALLPSQVLHGTLVAGDMSASTATLTLNFKTNLNSQSATPKIYGLTRDQAVVVTVNIIYNNGTEDVKVVRAVKVQDCSCGCTVKSNLPVGYLTFMCYNLGADPNKSIAEQMAYTPSPSGDASTDATVYGHLYQWGRVADGHQMRNSSAVNGGSGATTISYDGNSQIPIGHAWYGKHVYFGNSPYDWHGNSSTNKNDNLWNFTTYPGNNPCPEGWRVPNQEEWASVTSSINTWTWSSGATAGYKISTDGGTTTSLFLPAAGYRYYDGATLSSAGTSSYYWSTTVNSAGAYDVHFNSGNVGMGYIGNRAFGFSVRCLAEY